MNLGLPRPGVAALATLGTRLLRLGVATSALALCGCGAALSSWIVSTRDHQGDLALESRRYAEAADAYRLALQVDSEDARARAGVVESEASVAAMLYAKSKFDDALKELDVAAKYDPQSVRVAGLRSDIESARIKSQIVKSNYPAYAETTAGIAKGYAQINAETEQIRDLIKRFGYTYDTANLSSAIRASSDLSATVAKLTTRLTSLRTLVSTGAASPDSSAVPTGGGGSLLPLP